MGSSVGGGQFPSPEANPPEYQTQLNPLEKIAFDAWRTGNQVPYTPDPKSDYDMQGFYKGKMTGNPNAQQGFNYGDMKMHFPDTWKTPYHKTFSNESIYAPPDAPHWTGDDKTGWKLIDKTGKVVFDEAAPK